MSNKKDRIKVAAEDLREMLEELEPYIRRPVVIKPSTKGRWIRSDGKIVKLRMPPWQSRGASLFY